jgi:hypothetical protein
MIGWNRTEEECAQLAGLKYRCYGRYLAATASATHFGSSTLIVAIEEVCSRMKITALILFLVLAISVECDAGTTGVLHGFVRDPAGQPVTNARVTAASLSQTCTTYTDGRGFFVCLTLPPDVYTVRAQKPGTSDAYAPAVRVSSDQTTFLVFRFDTYRGCPAFTSAPLAAAPFVSLDVRRMESFPPNAAPPIPLPRSPFRRPIGCL